MSYYAINNNELYHHGIKGQKWGVRRFQNEDGSLTAKGEKRYNKEEKRAAKKRIKQNRKQMMRERSMPVRAFGVLTGSRSYDKIYYNELAKKMEYDKMSKEEARNAVKPTVYKKAAVKYLATTAGLAALGAGMSVAMQYYANNN